MKKIIEKIRTNFVRRLADNSEKYGKDSPVVNEDCEILEVLNTLAKLANLLEEE